MNPSMGYQNKTQSMQWKHPGSPTYTRNSGYHLLAGKSWPWCLRIGNALEFKGSHQEKQQGKVTSGVLLLHENAHLHNSQTAIAAIQNSGLQ
jgi:hypothetical protein